MPSPSFHRQRCLPRRLLTVFMLGLAWLPCRLQAQEPTPAATRDYNATGALQNSGLYARAADKWAQFVKDYPSDPRLDRAHYNLGVCQLHAKKFPEAAATFRTVLAKYPKFSMLDGAQYNLGLALLQAAGTTKKPADYQAAAAALSQAASKNPQGDYAPKALYYQGEALYSAGDAKGAVEVYKKVIAAYPKQPVAADAYYALGTAQQELRLDADAAATFRAFLANPAYADHPLVPEMKLRLGIAHLGQKQHAQAEKLLAEAAALKDFALADLAMLKQAQGRAETGKLAEAATLYGELLTKFPQSTQRNAALLAQGKCYFLAGRFDVAQPPLLEVTRAAVPESPEAAYWLGRSLLKLNKPEPALKFLDWSLANYAQGEFVPYLQLTRIDALYDLPERRKETPPLYDVFVKRYPDHPLTPQAVYMASLSALGQKSYRPARAHAEAFLANPKYAAHELYPAVLYVAAESHLQAATEGDAAADLNRAKQLYEQLTAKYPQHDRSAASLLRVGWTQYQAKQYDATLAYLEATAPKLKDPAQAAEAKFLAGRCLSATGRDKEAVAAYDASLAAKPDWPRAPEALIASAQSCRALADPAAATERLKRLIATYSTSSYRAQAVYQCGEIAQEQKNYDEAIARYQELIAGFPTSEFVRPAHYGLGVVYFAKNDFAKAVASLDALLAKPATADLTSRGRYLRGLAHHRLQQFAPAVADLQAYLTAVPEGNEALDARFALGLCQVGLGQFDKGAAALATLAKAKPDYSHIDKVQYELGHALLQAKQPAEAAAAFRALAEKHAASPLAPEGWFQVGRYHESLAEQKAGVEAAAEFANAAKAYSSGLAKAQTPELREKLQYKLGDMLYRQDKFAEAAAQLNAQLKEYPQGPLSGPAAFLSGECQYRAGEFAKALPLFEQVINGKGEKFLAQALYRAGACAGRLENWKASRQHYEALLAQFPNSEHVPEARYGLGWSLKQQGQLAAARTALEQVTKETEAEAAAKARFMIGEIAFEEKKYDEAIEHFLVVAVGYPFAQWQGFARFEAGRCFEQLKQRDKAIESLQIVVDKFPNHPKAKVAAEMIANLKK